MLDLGIASATLSCICYYICSEQFSFFLISQELVCVEEIKIEDINLHVLHCSAHYLLMMLPRRRKQAQNLSCISVLYIFFIYTVLPYYMSPMFLLIACSVDNYYSFKLLASM